MKILETTYIIIIGLSFLVSLSAFRWNFPVHLKFFSILLGLTFLVEFCAVYVVRKLHLQTNSPIYNSFMLIEFCAYAFLFKYIFRNKTSIAITYIILIVLPVNWIDSTILKFGFTRWNSYFLIVGSCCTIILALTYYYELLAYTEPVRLLKRPEFIIATGMLIFYTCLLPYLGSLNYLSNHHKPLAISLMNVLRILNIAMYSLFIYAFICQTTIRK